MHDANAQVDILYVITKSNWGGAQRYVYDIAVAAHATRRVAVALGGDGMLAQRLTEAGIPVYHIEAFQRDIDLTKEIGAGNELFALFQKLKPTIVHLNSSKAGGLGALAARIAGVPNVVYTSHGLPYEEDRPLWQKAAIAIATWVTFLLCTKVIIITHANLASVRRMPLLGNRPELIRLGIAPAPQLAKTTARTKLAKMCAMEKRPAGSIWIGTIAEYHPNKGLIYLIDAIAMLRAKHEHVTCVLIGSGELAASLQDEIARHGLEGCVFLTGFLEDAATYLAAFDAFVLPSIKEGLPYVLLEAGAAGLPFVGSAIPGIQEVVTDMSSGVIVRPKEPRELAGALALLLEDPTRRADFGKTLQKRVLDDFSSSRMIEATLGLYTHLS